MSDQKQFTLGRVENVLQRSKEIGSNKSYAVAVRSVEVACACGHAWTAREGNGLQNVIGGVQLTCPKCAASGFAKPRMLSGS